MRSALKALISRRRFEALALLIALVFSAVHWWADDRPAIENQNSVGPVLRAIRWMEGRATDTKFRVRGPVAPHPDVAVVVVDEKSVQKYGRWPWSRSLIGKSITRMHEAGVASVGMDMIFTDEAQGTSEGAYKEALSAFDQTVGQAVGQTVSAGGNAVQFASYRAALVKKAANSEDRDLANAFAQAPEVVMGVVAYSSAEREQLAAREDEQNRLLEKHVLREFPSENGLSKYEVPLEQVHIWKSWSAQTPLPAFAKEARHLGYFNAGLDPDGVLRRIPIFTRLDAAKGLLPGLALQTAAVAMGATVEPLWDPDHEHLWGARLRKPDGSSVRVPLGAPDPFTLVNHLGDRSVFPRYSLSDVVDGTVGADKLKGKAVLMGVDLVGLYDQRVTPFHENEAGVYSHASLLSNILEGRFLTRPWELRLLELLFMVGAALALARFMPKARFHWKLAGVLLLLGGWLALDQWMFTGPKLNLATAMPVANLLTTSFAIIFLGYLTTDREKGQLRSAFQHYLNESVMEQMLQNPDMLKLGGEKKEMTVLFSDIRGFTTLSERMSPEALVKFINSYLTPMTRIVFKEGGTLDKYIGDALMAFWGAPVDQPDHAVRACRTAVQFIEKLEELKVEWLKDGMPGLDIGVGINSGQMIVGNMGSDVRFDYTVMGDAVNLASRLEGTSKTYGIRLLISEATYLQAKDAIVARRLGAVRVKGKRVPVRIYELRAMGKASAKDAEAIAIMDAALDAYTEQRFEEAEARFEKLLTLWPDDPPARRYLDEIAVLKTRPKDPDWDGVYTATTK